MAVLKKSTPLSFWPHNVSLKRRGAIAYVFEASHATLPLYFALKDKHGYTLANTEELLAVLRPLLADVALAYDVVVYPESRFPFLRQLAEGLPAAIELRKQSKDVVCGLAKASANWGRLERQSQERAWLEMGDSFTINTIKSNQRKRYVPYLFETRDLDPAARVLLLDDFIMSGNTLAAMRLAVGREEADAFGVFRQTLAPGPDC